MIKKIYVLDINKYLSLIEDIYNKYTDDILPLYFARGYRYPVEKRSGYFEISSQPYYPWKCVDFVTVVLTKIIYNQSKDKELFVKNPLINGKSKNLHPYAKTPIDEILCRYLQTEYIDLDDIDIIIDTIEDIYTNEIECIVKMDKDGIWEFNYETQNIFLCYKDDIRSFRFKELLEYQEVNVLTK